MAKELSPPAKSGKDAAIELIRAVGASIPVAATLASYIHTDQEIETGFFLAEVARRINALENLSEQTLFMKANNGDEKAKEIIIKSWRRLASAFSEAHDEDKKEALRQAAVSVPLETGEGVAASVEHDRFMKLVREFDGLHIRLLKAGRYIRSVQEIVHGIDGEPMAAFVAEGRVSHPVKPGEKAWKELFENGLVNTDVVDCFMTEEGYAAENRTDLGLRFLAFITGKEEG